MERVNVQFPLWSRYKSIVEGGGGLKSSSSDKETIQHQYDALAKKIIRGEAKSCFRDMAKRSDNESLFCEMSDEDMQELYSVDEYTSDFFEFHTYGYEILVKNDLLADALGYLSEKNRDIVLLSYYLDMSDEEIGKLLNVVRSTVFRHRKAAIRKIKEYMEGK